MRVDLTQVDTPVGLAIEAKADLASAVFSYPDMPLGMSGFAKTLIGCGAHPMTPVQIYSNMTGKVGHTTLWHLLIIWQRYIQ